MDVKLPVHMSMSQRPSSGSLDRPGLRGETKKRLDIADQRVAVHQVSIDGQVERGRVWVTEERSSREVAGLR